MIFLPVPSTHGMIAVRLAGSADAATAVIRREGDYRPLEISAEYRAMAADGLVGAGRGRDLADLVIDREIDSGLSWQLPIALSDRVNRGRHRSTPDAAAASAAVFATGALTRHGAIVRHDYALELKRRAWFDAVAPDRPTLFLLPPSPGRAAVAAALCDGAHPNRRVVAVDDLAAATAALSDWLAHLEAAGTLAPAGGPPIRPTRRRKIAIAGLSAAAVAVATFAGVAATMRRAPEPTPPAAGGTATEAPAADFTTASAPREPPAPPSTLHGDVVAAALEPRDGASCPSVELDTDLVRPTPLAVGADFLVGVPADRLVCGVEIALRPGAPLRIVVSPALSRSALLTRFPDGRLRLRPHADVALSDLVVDLRGPADGERLQLRFAVR